MPEANIKPPTDDKTTEDGAPAGTEDPAVTEQAAVTGEPADAGEETGAAQGDEGEPGEQAELAEPAEPADRTGLTPRQARRARIVVSGIVMVAVAVALVVRLGSAPSVLTVGFYGIALILSGTAIGLSRRGRTRVATGVLVLGFAAVALAEWLLASVQ